MSAHCVMLATASSTPGGRIGEALEGGRTDVGDDDDNDIGRGGGQEMPR